MVLDVGDLLGITDHFVITSGSNVRQVRTIAEEIELRVKEQGGGSPRYIEGLDDARWVLLDYGQFVVHVFLAEARRYYDLERLWADAPRVEQAGRRRIASGSSSRVFAAGRKAPRHGAAWSRDQLRVVGAVHDEACRE